jgi:hypothetical protein
MELFAIHQPWLKLQKTCTQVDGFDAGSPLEAACPLYQL